VAPPVQLIFTDNPGGLPATYTLPPNLDLDLASVRAKIDGTGAGGSFLVCLSILSSDDKLMARVPLDTTYSAGDTGEGTWAPFLRSQSTGSTPVTTTVVDATLSKAAFDPALSVTTGVPWDTFDTSDTTVFNTSATNGGAINNTAGDAWLRMTGAGVYFVQADTDWSANGIGQFMQFSRGNFFLLSEGGVYADRKTPSAVFDGNKVTFVGYQPSGSSASYLQININDGSTNNTVDVSLGVVYVPCGDLANVF